MKIRILFVLLAVVAALFLWIAPAGANPVLVESYDDPSQDPLNVQGWYEEIGEIGIFPVHESLISSGSSTDYRPCPENYDDPNIPNALVWIYNNTGRDLFDVYYVADPDTWFQNYDGYIGNAGIGEGDLCQAFRIDSIGINTPLIYESMNQDNIWQAGESWYFVIQDFQNTWGGPATPFDSLGIASLSSGYPPSTGSIIAIPEPSTITLLLFGAVGLMVFRWRRRRQL